MHVSHLAPTAADAAAEVATLLAAEREAGPPAAATTAAPGCACAHAFDGLRWLFEVRAPLPAAAATAFSAAMVDADTCLPVWGGPDRGGRSGGVACAFPPKHKGVDLLCL
jgi:hypothetical protein